MAALFSSRCCICGSTGHSLRRCLAPFKHSFSLFNPEFATHDVDGSIFETWKEKMRRRGSDRRLQDNGRRNASGNGNFRPYDRGSHSTSQGNSSGITHATNVAAAAPQSLALSGAPGPAPAFTAAPLMRYGPAFSGNTNPNPRRPGTFQVPPTPTP